MSQIYKPYHYKYFVENYPMRYDSMFKKYKNMKRQQYDYFITFNNLTPIYFNGTYEEAINWILDKDIEQGFEYVCIEDLKWNDKECYKKPKYHKLLNIGNEFQVSHWYYDKYNYFIGRYTQGNLDYDEMHYYEKGNHLYSRIDFMDILEFNIESGGKFCFCKYNLESKKWETTVTRTFDTWLYRDINSEDIEQIKKVLKKMNKKDNKGFYEREIKLVCDVLGLRENDL